MSEQVQESQVEQVVAEQEVPQVEGQEVTEQEKQLIRKVKLKVDGKEFEEELPFDIAPEHEEYFRNQLQLAKAAQKRMQEAAELRKTKDQMQNDLVDLIESLKNPSALKEFLADPRVGVDVKQFAKEIIEEEKKELEKSPEQREREQLLKEREEMKTRLEAIQKEKEEAERSRELQEVLASTENSIISAIKENELTSDARVIKRFADAMRAGLNFGVELTPQELGPIIKKQMYEEAKFYLDQLKDEELSDFVGKDRLTRVRQKMLSSVKKSIPSAKEVADTGMAEKEKIDSMLGQKKSYKKSSDFFKKLR